MFVRAKLKRPNISMNYNNAIEIVL